jgi:hypothetical protein
MNLLRMQDEVGRCEDGPVLAIVLKESQKGRKKGCLLSHPFL